MQHKFKIGNANLSYNFSDSNKAEDYETAVKTVSVIMQNVPKDVPISGQIRYICGGIFNMFDDLFGAGTAKKIFGESCDVVQSTQALAQLVEAYRAADNEIAEEMLKLRDVIMTTPTK